MAPPPATSRPQINGSSASAPTVQPAVGHTYRHEHWPPSLPFSSAQVHVQSVHIPTACQGALQQPEISLPALHLASEMHLAQHVLPSSMWWNSGAKEQKCSCDNRRRCYRSDLLLCAGAWRSLRLGLKGCMCDWSQGCGALCPRLRWTSPTIPIPEPSGLAEPLM